MDRRNIVIQALRFEKPAYVPWSYRLTQRCAQRLAESLSTKELDDFLAPHIFDVRSHLRDTEAIDADHVRDRYGVTWDRSVDHDIGSPCDWPIKNRDDLDRYAFPDANNLCEYEHLPAQLAQHLGRFRRYSLAMCLFERSWSLRGFEDLLADMASDAGFVEALFDRVLEHHLTLLSHVLKLDIDGVHFGDDYGMQTALIMGPSVWRRLIKPRLSRMFAAARDAGKFVSLHSCGAVTEILPDLIEIGLDFFNPFQPEAMDVFALLRQYRGRLAFHGGLSIQQTLPRGNVDEVRRESRRLIDAGKEGGYIFAPSHDVPSDVLPENLIAMMEVLKGQIEYDRQGADSDE